MNSNVSQVINIKRGKNFTYVAPINMYGVEVGDDVFIGPFCEIQKDVIVGSNVRIQSHSFICENTYIGDDTFIAHGVMFTKSSTNMHYGRHVDNPFMSSGRSDLSFTISLTNKNSYKGGELNIETINSEKEFKLNNGEIVIYPSTFLHSVNKVTDGERIVCVGWIESYVKSIEEREYLFDLDAGAKGLLAKNGRSDELDLIFKSYSNLLRLLGN